jgi:hypothetical protein
MKLALRNMNTLKRNNTTLQLEDQVVNSRQDSPNHKVNNHDK